ncbi:MAG TPA: R3H domain-containing nucleic acid-binding protein [Candidatus Moranbacteria bacterium]|nr:R3H domain-containing nucleic acid-binding protein [Candidatus Moranbacteria bacterium]
MENEKISEEAKEEIKKTVEELVQKMGFECQVEANETETEDQPELIFNIKTKESNYLIGQYGVNLQALQHIARIIFRGKTQNKANFTLDVNSYRQEKNASVFALAKNMAEQAIREGRAVVMRPMSPYERRLVHMELSKNEQVKTESTGEGEDRRVVIKPANLV